MRFFCRPIGVQLRRPAAEPHWNIQYHYRQVDSSLTINDLAFPSATRGIACGSTTDRHNNEHPLVLVTSDGGQHWTETPVKESCMSLFFLDDSTGWMVTDKGIWQTAESGRSWKKLKVPAGMLRVWFLDAGHGFAAGLEKRVFQTTDGGESWTLVPVSKDVQGDAEYTTSARSPSPENMASFQAGTFRPARGGPDWMEPEKAETPAADSQPHRVSANHRRRRHLDQERDISVRPDHAHQHDPSGHRRSD